MTAKYLFNIYDSEIENNKLYYIAFAAIIDMKKKVGNKDYETIGGKDIRESNEIDDKTPVAKVTFNENGIKKFEINENMNDTLATYLYEFVEKTIPKVTKKSFNENSNQETRTYKGDQNKGKITHYKETRSNDNEEFKNWEIEIEDNKIKSLSDTKDFALIKNEENEINVGLNEENYTLNIETDGYTNREGIIKQILNNDTSKLTLSDESTNDKELTTKLFGLLNEIEFKEYKTNNRRLEIITKKLDNFRNLQGMEIATYYMPIYYKYPLFKSHLLGSKIGLYVEVSFLPKNGMFYMDLIFEHDKIKENIYTKTKKTNFDNISKHIYNITQQVYNILIDNNDTLKPIFNEYENKIGEKLVILNNILSEYPEVTNVFDEELKRILRVVNDSTAVCYNAAHGNSSVATYEFEQILYKIKNNELDFINQISSSSSLSIKNFLTENQYNLSKLYEAWKEFYTKSTNELSLKTNLLKTNPYLQFDIGLYYNIKDDMKSILNIYQNFINDLSDTLNIEKTKFGVYVDKKFDEIIDPELRKAEQIAENANNNVSVIDSMRIFFGKEVGDEIRTTMISQINSFRNTLDTIMDEIYLKLSNIYSTELKSDDFQTIKNYISTKFDEIKQDQDYIISQLTLFNKYDENFDIYFEDIKLLNQLEFEANEGKKLSYQKYIDEYLNAQSDYFLDDIEINDITTTFNNYFKYILEELGKYHSTNALEESEKLLEKVNLINNQYLSETLATKIINYYTNNNFLTEMFNNYYNELNEVYKKFNTSFYDVNYMNHRDLYVSKPTELLGKLLEISNALSPSNSLLYKTIQNLIVRKIRLGISSTTRQIYGIILQEYNSFIQNIINNKCCINGYYDANIDTIKNNLVKFKEVYIDELGRFIPFYLYNPSNKEDEFNLLNIINPKEKAIRNNLRRIYDEINADFHDNFCYGTDIVCPFDNVVSAIEHYYYQASKLRVSLSFIQSIVTVAQNMIGDDVLSGLNVNKFTQLYKTELNYRGKQILTDINEFLYNLNIESASLIKESINGLKSDIQSYFLSGVNNDLIKAYITNIAESIYINPADFLQKIKNYLYEPCGPISKLENAFNQEMNYYETLYDGKYVFDQEKYKASFENAYQEIMDEYTNQENILFNNLGVSSSLKTQLKNTISNFIELSYESILDKVNNIADITEFEMLNISYSLLDISFDALYEKKSELLNIVDDLIESIYVTKLNSLINSIKSDFQNVVEQVHIAINYEYTKVSNHFIVNDDSSADSTITQIRNSTVGELRNFVSLFFKKVDSIYNQDSIDEELENKQNQFIEEKSLKVTFKDFSSSIRDYILTLSELTYSRYVEEKTLFQSQIKIFFERAFNNSFEEFILSSGANYLNDSVYSDYEKRIYPDFDIMKIAITDTYNSINTLLTAPELQGLGVILVDKIIEVFPYVKEEIAKIIPNKVENIIWTKIDLFQKEAEDKITRLYINELETEISKLQNELSSKVYQLVPKQLESPFKGIIENSFRERIAKSIKDIKDIYSISVEGDLSEIVKDLDSKDKYISKKISSVTITKPESEWGKMADIYNNLTNSIQYYKNNYTFEVSKEKMDYIEQFFTITINPLLTNIYNGFYEYVLIGQINLNYALDYFDISNTLIRDGLVNITNSREIYTNIYQIYQDLSNIFIEFKNSIIGNFTEFKTIFKTKVKEIEIKGFDYVANRNLEENVEYDIAEIKKVYKAINERYEEFKYNVLTKNDFYEIEGKKGGMQHTLVNIANTLTRDFYFYEHLINQYTSNDKIKQYFSKLNGKAEVIKREILVFVTNVAGNISKTVDLVKLETDNSWEIVKAQTNSMISELLDNTFKEKLQKLVALEKEEHETFNKFTFLPLIVEVVNSNNEIINTIDITINVINVSAGYSLKRLGIYDFTMDVFTGGSIELNATTYINNQLVETMAGTLASGKVGVSANYTLHNMGVDIDAYAILDKVNYSLDAKTIEEWYKIYEGYQEIEGRELHIKRKIRSTHYES